MWKQRDFSVNGFALVRGWMLYLCKFHFLHLEYKHVAEILNSWVWPKGAFCLSDWERAKVNSSFWL